MKISVPIPCFFSKISVPDAIRQIGTLGFDTAETYGWQNLNADEVRRACEESRVNLISMCTSDFELTVPENRANYVKCLRESCEAAKKLGAQFLITQGGSNTGEDRRKQHDSIREGLLACKPICEDYGVTLLLEPLNTLVDHKRSYLWSSGEAFELIREADSPFVKVVYDIYHQQIMEGNIISTITGNMDCIAHLHCAGTPGRHELQTGEIDYKVVFKRLDEAGYKGACGIEYNPLTESVESLKAFRSAYADCID